jgi:hypothetical protein
MMLTIPRALVLTLAVVAIAWASHNAGASQVCKGGPLPPGWTVEEVK